MIEQLFEVATEFQFNVGQAMLNTQALTDSVNKLSSASNGALGSLQYLASGLVAHLGFGSGGLLTVLSKAVQISEDFDAQALNFSNNIMSNFNLLQGPIDTFNGRLAVSQQILEDISKTAVKFALPTNDLARITSLIATPLAQHGKLGKNYGGAIDMAKNLMLGSEAVGLNSSMGAESLYRSLTDKMPLHGALFSRLINTSAFKGSHIMTQQQLMNMNADRKIDLIGKALKSLASDSEALDFRLKSLHGQFTILMDLVSSVGSVLRPIGDAIRKPLAQLLAAINGYLMEHGKEIGQNIGQFLGNMLADPKQLFLGLYQLKNLGQDLKKSWHATEITMTLTFVVSILRKLGLINGGLIRVLFSGIGSFFSMIGSGAMFLIRNIGMVARVFKFIGEAVGAVLGPLLAFLFVFQTISRAKAVAHLNDLRNALIIGPKLAVAFARIKDALSNILLPITTAMDALANFIAPIFEVSVWGKYALPVLDAIASVLEVLGKASILAYAGFQGLVFGILQFIDNIKHGKLFAGVPDAFNAGVNDVIERNADRLFKDGRMQATANNVTNIGKVEIRNDFKEQMEPDRIAFSLKEQLFKAARNPTQGRGSSMGGAYTGAPFGGSK